jgi:hypothetical protein
VGFRTLLGQSEFKGLKFFQDVNQEGVDTVVVTVEHLNCPSEDTRVGFTYITLRDDAGTNGAIEYNFFFKVLDLLQDC